MDGAATSVAADGVNPSKIVRNGAKSIISRSTWRLDAEIQASERFDQTFPKYTRGFLAALHDLLHGAGDASDRLKRFSGVLADMGLRKWTYATFFLFLSDTANCMFVKPEGLKRAVEITRYPMEYEPTPSAALYRDILAFPKWLKAKLEQQGSEALKPEDMIDVQSFIWHMAPTGKFAES